MRDTDKAIQDLLDGTACGTAVWGNYAEKECKLLLSKVTVLNKFSATPSLGLALAKLSDILTTVKQCRPSNSQLQRSENGWRLNSSWGETRALLLRTLDDIRAEQDVNGSAADAESEDSDPANEETIRGRPVLKRDRLGDRLQTSSDLKNSTTDRAGDGRPDHKMLSLNVDATSSGDQSFLREAQQIHDYDHHPNKDSQPKLFFNTTSKNTRNPGAWVRGAARVTSAAPTIVLNRSKGYTNYLGTILHDNHPATRARYTAPLPATSTSLASDSTARIVPKREDNRTFRRVKPGGVHQMQTQWQLLDPGIDQSRSDRSDSTSKATEQGAINTIYDNLGNATSLGNNLSRPKSPRNSIMNGINETFDRQGDPTWRTEKRLGKGESQTTITNSEHFHFKLEEDKPPFIQQQPNQPDPTASDRKQAMRDALNAVYRDKTGEDDLVVDAYLQCLDQVRIIAQGSASLETYAKLAEAKATVELRRSKTSVSDMSSVCSDMNGKSKNLAKLDLTLNEASILERTQKNVSSNSDTVAKDIDKTQSRQCTFCREQLHNTAELERHMLRHISSFKCNDPRCDEYAEGFPTLNALRAHIEESHPGAEHTKRSDTSQIGEAMERLTTLYIIYLPTEISEDELRKWLVELEGFKRFHFRHTQNPSICLAQFEDDRSAREALKSLDVTSRLGSKKGFCHGVLETPVDFHSVHGPYPIQDLDEAEFSSLLAKDTHAQKSEESLQQFLYAPDNHNEPTEHHTQQEDSTNPKEALSLLPDEGFDSSLLVQGLPKVSKEHPSPGTQPKPVTSIGTKTLLHSTSFLSDFDSDSDHGSVASTTASTTFSGASSKASSQSSIASVAQLELFEECLKAMQEHPRFSQICLDAVQSIEAQKFERNLNRFLRIFSGDLRQNASEALESQVARYLRTRAGEVAKRVTETFFKSSAQLKSTTARVVPLRSCELDKLTEALDADEDDSEDDELGEPEMSTESGPEALSSFKLPFEQVQNFVMNSSAFETFLERLEVSVKRARSKRFLRMVDCVNCGLQCTKSSLSTLHFCKKARAWRCNLLVCRGLEKTFETAEDGLMHQLHAHGIDESLHVCPRSECVMKMRVWPDTPDYRAHCEYAHPKENADELVALSSSFWRRSEPMLNDDDDDDDAKSLEHSEVATSDANDALRHSRYQAYPIRTRVLAQFRNFVDQTRPSLPEPGKRRIYFNCSCGRQIAGDYKENSPGGLDKLQDIFDAMSRRDSRRPHHHPQAPQSSPYQHPSSIESFEHGIRSSLSGLSGSSSTISSSSTLLPSYKDSNALVQSAQARRESNGCSNYLLLCVPHKRHGSRVHQPSSDWILSDYAFFVALRDQYKATRGRLRHAFSWRALRQLRFVRFEMFTSQLAQIQKLDDLPPLAYRDAYEYEPVEWSPPIHPQHMLHLIEHPDDAQRSLVLFRCVPKKLREKLEACPVRGKCEGWGIQYIEDIDQERVCFVVFLCALLSLAAATSWTAVKRDVQGGFAIGGTLFVILTSGVGSVEMMCRGQ